MKKIIAIILVALAVLIPSGIFVYKKFDTRTTAQERSSFKNVFKDKINIEYLQDYLKDHPKDTVVFIKDQDTDSNYVMDSLLTPLANEQKEQTLPSILTVEIPNDSSISVTRLKNMLEIDGYPAFIYLKFKDNEHHIESNIVYDSDTPMTSDELKTWFFENGLWNGPYGVR